MTSLALPQSKSRLRAYRLLAGLGVRTIFTHRANYMLGMVGVLIQVLLLCLVWRAVYAGRTMIDGVDLATMTAYVTVINVQSWLVLTSANSLLPARIRDGNVAFDLSRPVGLVAQLVCGQLGQTLAMLPFAALALPLAAIVGGIRPPASPPAAAGYVLSLVLALAVSQLVGTIIALVAFWTFDVRGLQFIYRSVAPFLSGTLVPLWFMPGWLRTIAEWLPFQATAYTPVSIYLGQIGGADVASALGVQALWVGALFIACFALWRGAVHRVVIQGG